MPPLKKLKVSEEDFFLMVQLVCGPPKQEYFNYYSTQWVRGIGGWIADTPEGRQFTRCVTECGEAKTRAANWYIKYSHWWRKQHGLTKSPSTR